MDHRWLKGTEDTEARKNLVLASSNILEVLEAMLKEDLEGARKSLKTDYDNPSWSHLQAHKNGEMGVLTKYIELINKRK